jgi:hypothetical protein
MLLQKKVTPGRCEHYVASAKDSPKVCGKTATHVILPSAETSKYATTLYLCTACAEDIARFIGRVGRAKVMPTRIG